MRSIIFSLFLFAQAGYGQDFNTQGAISKWLNLTMAAKTVCHSHHFENSYSYAVDKFLKKGDPWLVKAMVNYKNSLSFPVTTKDVIVSLSPFKTVRIPIAGFYYIQRKDNLDRRLVLGVSETNYCIMQASTAEAYQDSKEVYTALLSEVTNNSRFKGGVLQFKMPSGLIGFYEATKDHKYDWDSIILEPNLKARVKGSIESFINGYELKKWKELGLPLNRGVLLYGPPGTGKSVVAKIMISKVLQNKFKQNITYLHVQARHIDNVDSVKKIYDTARSFSPAIVFIEDIDLIAGTGRAVMPEIKNELMQQLSGIEALHGVITIATTNAFEGLDPALKRSKRLGFHYEIGYPSYDERLDLYKLFTKKFAGSLDYHHHAVNSESYSGADIKAMVDLASQYAVEAKSYQGQQLLLTNDHLETALSELAESKQSFRGIE